MRNHGNRTALCWSCCWWCCCNCRSKKLAFTIYQACRPACNTSILVAASSAVRHVCRQQPSSFTSLSDRLLLNGRVQHPATHSFMYRKRIDSFFYLCKCPEIDVRNGNKPCNYSINHSDPFSVHWDYFAIIIVCFFLRRRSNSWRIIYLPTSFYALLLCLFHIAIILKSIYCSGLSWWNV